MLYRRFIALPLALICLAPLRAQTPPASPAPAAPAAPDPAADRESLADAIRSRDVAKATKLLDADPQIIKMQDSQNRLPLTEALEFNWGEDRTSMPALLIARGADVNASDAQGQTPLVLDLSRGNDQDGKVFDFLVSKGASLTAAGSDGLTPIHAAAYQRNVDSVNRLLAHGVSPNLRARTGDTPLHAAVFSGDPKTVAALLNSGADVNLRNGRGDTPLHLALRLAGLPGNPAASHGNLGGYSYSYSGSDARPAQTIAPTLIERGAKVDQRDQYGLTPLMYTLLNRDNADRLLLLRHHAPVDTQTAFFQAAALDDLPTLTRLAHANPALPLMRNASGATPLHVAALWNARRSQAWLLKHGGATTDRDGYALCPLHYACRAPNAQGTAADLIAAGANVSAESGTGETPLFYAVRAQANDTVSLLLAHKAAADARNENSETPLMVVPDFQRTALVAHLLKAGADPNARARWGGQSVLFNAAGSGSKEAVALLLKAGADPNATSNGNGNALMQAIQSNKKDMVTLLLDAGADPRRKGWGQTPLEAANGSERKEIAALIQAKLDATAK